MKQTISQQAEGWVKLYRSLLTKPLWTETTAEQKVLLISLLMRASYTARSWIHQGIVYQLEPGQLITSINSLIEIGGAGVTHRKVRTALNLFEKSGFLTQKTSNKNTLITIENWESYQGDVVSPTQETSHPRHTPDTQVSHHRATNKKLRSKEGREGEEQHHRKQNRVAGATQWCCCSETEQNKVLLLYQDTCTSLPRVRNFSEKRRQAIDKCWQVLSRYGMDSNLDNDLNCLHHVDDGKMDRFDLDVIRERAHGADKVLALFAEGFEVAEATVFLKGINEKGWKADFDWLMKPENMMKVLENKYRWETPTFQQSSHQQNQYHRPKAKITGFHLPEESRRERYTNEQLEAILLGKKQKRHKAAEDGKVGEVGEEGSTHGLGE